MCEVKGNNSNTSLHVIIIFCNFIDFMSMPPYCQTLSNLLSTSYGNLKIPLHLRSTLTSTYRFSLLFAICYYLVPAHIEGRVKAQLAIKNWFVNLGYVERIVQYLFLTTRRQRNKGRRYLLAQNIFLICFTNSK